MQKFRKLFLSIIITITLLNSCSFPSEDVVDGPQTPENRTKVEFWTIVDPLVNTEYQDVVNAFNTSQIQYEVVLVTVEDIETAFQTAIASGGNVPDVIEIWNQNIAPYTEGGALISLDKYIEKQNISLNQYRSGVVDLTRYKGKIMGLPNNFTPLFFICNQRLLIETYGIDAKVPSDWKGFDKWLSDMQKVDTNGKIISIGWWPNYTDWYSYLYGVYNGGSFYNEEGSPIVTSEEWVDAYKFLNRKFYLEQSNIQEFQNFVSGFGGFAEPTDPFYTGQVACTVGAEYVYMGLDWFSAGEGEVEALAAEDLKTYAFPTSDGKPIIFVQLNLLSIPSSSDAKDGGWAFIEFWQSPEILEQFSIGRQGVSVLAETAPGWIKEINNPLIPQFIELLDIGTLVSIPYTPSWYRIHDAFDSVMDSALNNGDIEAALHEAAVAAKE